MTGYLTVPSVSWGPAAIEQLSSLGARRAFVLADPFFKDRPALVRVTEELAKSDASVDVVYAVPGEPTVASVETAAESMRAARPEWIVALGGGSTIDTARGAWCRLARPDVPLDQVTPLVELRARAAARFVAIPTTSASGSDAAWVAHVRAPDGRPLEAGSRELLADWSLVDPDLARSVPLPRAAEGAADVIAHALEAILSEWSNPFSDAMAREALGLALPALDRLPKHSSEGDPRAALHYAATLAGMATANAHIGVAHALAHAIGGVTDVPHARLVAALLPTAMEFDFPSCREKLQGITAIAGPSVAQSRPALGHRLRTTFEAAGLPKTLTAAGVPEAMLREHRTRIVEWARGSSAVVANPRVPSPTELGLLLDAAATGQPVTF